MTPSFEDAVLEFKVLKLSLCFVLLMNDNNVPHFDGTKFKSFQREPRKQFIVLHVLIQMYQKRVECVRGLPVTAFMCVSSESVMISSAPITDCNFL